PGAARGLRGRRGVARAQPSDGATPTTFQGTGTTRVQPTLVLSHVFGDRFEPLLNVGIDINAKSVELVSTRVDVAVALRCSCQAKLPPDAVCEPLANERLIGDGSSRGDLPQRLDLHGIELDGQVPEAARPRPAKDLTT